MEKNIDKRREILEAAIKLFSEKGFEKTTVDEIAARANVGKGTIYLYFENKEQIFIAVIKEGMSEISRQFEEILTRENFDFQKQLRELIYTHLKFVEDHHEFYRIFLKERVGFQFYDNEDARCHKLEALRKLQLLLADFIKKGMEQGYIRKGDPNQFATALGGIITHFAFSWFIEKDGIESLTAQTPAITEIFLFGVGNRAETINGRSN